MASIVAMVLVTLTQPITLEGKDLPKGEPVEIPFSALERLDALGIIASEDGEGDDIPSSGDDTPPPSKVETTVAPVKPTAQPKTKGE